MSNKLLLQPLSFIEKDKRKKILLLSDDLRFHSGIATVSRELVIGTAEQFNWVQLAAAEHHPENNKVIDISQSVNSELNINDSSIKLYGSNGYGDANKLREIISIEKPDAILHFTDPRYWEWLYIIENEIRQEIPLMYLNIWDDVPDPQYNQTAYASCDVLYSISKQTYGINKRVLGRYSHTTIDDTELLKTDDLIIEDKTLLSYLPHGINEDYFKPIYETDEQYDEYTKFKTQIKQSDDEFVVFWNNRNMHRKQVSTVILGFKNFVANVRELNGDDEANKIKLILHTSPVDGNGTDLPAVLSSLAPECNVSIIHSDLDVRAMNFLYNSVDLTINITSNEGFGLSTAESVMAGTPIIVNVTGGLQDQCGFINPKTNKYFTAEEYVSGYTLHSSKNMNLQHGEWCEVVYPSNRSIQGSIPTPYIFDDRVDFEELALAITKMYSYGTENRKARALTGRDFMLSDDTLLSAKHMCSKFYNVTSEFLSKWIPKRGIKLINTSEYNIDSSVSDSVLLTNNYKSEIQELIKKSANKINKDGK